MKHWYKKGLGYGAEIYSRLRALNALRHEICPSATVPFLLLIDVKSAQTFAFFPPDQGELAKAFGAQASASPKIDGVNLIDLEYQPLPVNEMSFDIYQAVPYRNHGRQSTRPNHPA